MGWSTATPVRLGKPVALGVVHQIWQGHEAYGPGTYVLLRLVDDSPPPRLADRMVAVSLKPEPTNE